MQTVTEKLAQGHRLPVRRANGIDGWRIGSGTDVQIGLSSFTYGWSVGVHGFPQPANPLSVFALLERCRQFGLNLLQIGDNIRLDQWSDRQLDELRAAAETANVALEVGARRLDETRLEAYFRIARRLEARLIRFIIDESGYHPTAAQVIELLRRKSCALNELTLGIENHDRFKSRELRQIVEAVDDPAVGICLDTSNSLGAAEDLQTVMSELADRTVNLHIKDFWIERLPYLMGFLVEGRPAGQGFLDVAAVWERMSRVPRCKTAVVELWTPPVLDQRGAIDIEATVAREAEWAQHSVAHVVNVARAAHGA